MARNPISYPSSYNENYTPEDQANIVRIVDWMNASTMRTNRHIAKCINKSDAYVSQLLAGKLPVEATPFIDTVLALMSQDDVDDAPGSFVETSVYKTILHACKMARASGRISVIAGVPGVGKTESLKHYKESNPNTIYLCGSEVINGTAVIDMIIADLGIRAASSLRKSDKVNLICDQLHQTKKLIILDETDKCHIDTPDPLRTISDRTGCGVVLAGNLKLRDDIIAGKGRYDLIESRVRFWPKPIMRISDGDVALLLKPYFKQPLINPEESFDELVAYAGKVTAGSARKLDSLVHNLQILCDANKGKEQAKFSRLMIKMVATEFMGIPNPPDIPRKISAV